MAYSAGILSDEEVWLEILQDRNILSHVYDSSKAKITIQKIKEKYLAAFKNLRTNIEENFLMNG
ncbi:MAG: nucleotidyltransferase substrate binding protein [Selenomonadaceae bacterium]|nr:nucleotidyltransferase substrate binding protein [Selenomonadaceae bacterium]